MDLEIPPARLNQQTGGGLVFPEHLEMVRSRLQEGGIVAVDLPESLRRGAMQVLPFGRHQGRDDGLPNQRVTEGHLTSPLLDQAHVRSFAQRSHQRVGFHVGHVTHQAVKAFRLRASKEWRALYLPGIQKKGADSSSSSAANPQVKRMIAVSDPFRLGWARRWDGKPNANASVKFPALLTTWTNRGGAFRSVSCGYRAENEMSKKVVGAAGIERLRSVSSLDRRQQLGANRPELRRLVAAAWTERGADMSFTAVP
jgi:hypothetical protein